MVDPKFRSAFTDPHVRERRRGERVLIRIPVILYGLTKENQHVTENAETAVISRTGALLRSRTVFKVGASLDLTNGFSKQADKFRVVWVGNEQKQGFFDLAVEMLTPHEDFWGITFPTRVAPKT